MYQKYPLVLNVLLDLGCTFGITSSLALLSIAEITLKMSEVWIILEQFGYHE